MDSVPFTAIPMFPFVKNNPVDGLFTNESDGCVTFPAPSRKEDVGAPLREIGILFT
jgi:hypothetical protein